MLDPDVSTALIAAGEKLAEALRQRLAAEGMVGTLSVSLDERRVIVSSASVELRAQELGTSDQPPTGLISDFLRVVLPSIVLELSENLQGCST